MNEEDDDEVTPVADPRTRIRIAAVGDLHQGKAGPGLHQSIFGALSERADVLLLCGDLTDYGLPEEARTLARDIAAVKIPVVAVLGNHDYESGRATEVIDILRDAGVKVLDGDAVEIEGVGFAGTKGFAGGFGPRMLAPWGEPSIKHFVHEAIDEALKLESALAKLRTPRRVVLLHYSPIAATVEGEPREIYPFLGSSRLEEPINRFRVAAVFHGHAHHGAPEGRTGSGVPVYNVALPLLARLHPDRVPVRVVELPTTEETPAELDRRVMDRRAAGPAEPAVAGGSGSGGGTERS
jgi:Icc-related predicted phosphoesterase